MDTPPSDPLAGPFRPQGNLDERTIMENVINSMSDGVLLLDAQGEITLVNPALSRVLGLPPEAIQGRSWAELFLLEPRNQDFNQLLVDVVQNRASHYNRQVSYLDPQGRHKDLIATTTLMTAGGEEGGELAGVLIVFNDISRLMELHRRENELLNHSRRLVQEKMEGLDRLARAVAHEIRNPVMTIGGLTLRLLHKEGADSPLAPYLERILADSRRLEQVVTEVRDYADLPAPHLAETDLVGLLYAVAASWWEPLARAGVLLRIEGIASLATTQVFVQADGAQLYHLLDILVQNAVDAMPQGGEVGLGLYGAGAHLLVEVRDQGRGIDPEDLKFLFDPFFSTKADAVGMSLAVAKRIALEHGGDLVAESSPEGGTRFRLTLPAEPLDMGLSPLSMQVRPPELK
ncbi:MAG: PAS domain-containing protein [Deltaproteobacteria bacterium]|nr:PAS domain-containing protein [Deltaproteobacteria bacterium]